MSSALLHLLPLAAAASISEIPMLTMIVLLLSPNRARSALPYVLGWTLGIFITVALATLGANATLPHPAHPHDHDRAVAYAEIALGVLVLLFAGWRLWRKRGAQSTRMPSWMHAIESMNGRSAFGVGLIFNARPKAILLAIAAGLILRGAHLSLGDTLVALGVYTLVAASTIVVPVAVTLVDPTRMQQPLANLQQWIERHRVLVSTVILVVVGMFLAIDGLVRL